MCSVGICDAYWPTSRWADMSRKDVLQRTPSSINQAPQGGSGPFGSFVKKNKVEAAINKKIQPAGWANAIKTALKTAANPEVLIFFPREIERKFLTY